MDTPEKSQIATPAPSKFEDSPVFSYINSLSPIKPPKSIHTTVTFNSLSFASPPSVFSSPQIDCHRESRCLKRNHLADPSGPDIPDCETENSAKGNSDDVHLFDLCAKQLSCDSPASLARELPIRAHEEHVNAIKEFKYGYESPDVNKPSRIPYKRENTPEMEHLPTSLIQYAVDGSKRSLYLFESETELGKFGQIEQIRETSGLDWEKLVSDATDLLCFNSPSNEHNAKRQDSKPVDSGTSSTSVVPELLKDNNDRLQQSKAGGSFREGDMELHVAQVGDDANLKEKVQVPKILAGTVLHKQVIRDSNPEVNDNDDKGVESGIQPGFQQQCSIRRLLFDRTEANKRKSGYDYCCATSMSLQTETKFVINEKQVVCTKAEKDYFSPMMPGIGLHLNALASSSNGINLVKDEALVTERQLRIIPDCGSFDPLMSGNKVQNTSFNNSSAELNPAAEENLASLSSEVPILRDATSSFEVEESNQTSPKKKRHKLERAAENEACKRCKCKKSKCLKLYCDCFAAGLYCVEPCSCQDCFNKPMYEETVLDTRKQIESRNPLAFAPKVIMSSELTAEFGDDCNKTPASARHKRGCNCKKSSCLKKYCECFQGGVGCSISCRCEGCKNTFGCKYGTEESETEMEGIHVCENNTPYGSSASNVVHKNEEPQGPLFPRTPSFVTSRSLVQLHSPVSVVEASPHISMDRKLENSSISHHLPKFGRRLQMIPENETINEILQDSYSPTRGVNSTSPNCKRVSPPLRRLRSFPALRNGRRLILRSIPSFPSLSQCENTNT
ncbi:hypothetical protein NMG60_11023622 [Bertholletia excelsa]